MGARALVVVCIAVLVAAAGASAAPPPVATKQPVDLVVPYGISVSDHRAVELTTKPGEITSTVVPPAKKRSCSSGRLLISNDAIKGPAEVVSFDLAALGAPLDKATFDLPPGWNATRRIRSHDHDLVTLPDGDVLLIKLGQTRAPLTPQPDWFEWTYKLTLPPEAWGPGARSEMLIWRSSDCGLTFDFVEAIDLALVDDEIGTPGDFSAAHPQFHKLPFVFLAQMGGTDGPLARVDPVTGRIFITLGLVGYLPAQTDPIFLLDPTKPLNRTVVMMSDDEGQSWTRAGLIPGPWRWRLDVVPRKNGNLAFGHASGDPGTAWAIDDVPIGFIPDPNVAYAVIPPPEPPAYWTATLEDVLSAKPMDRSILTRSPSGNDLLFAYMDTIPGKGGGFRLFRYGGGSAWDQFQPPIAPKSSNPADFSMHVTAVDPGQGPLLFYWYDVDTVDLEAAIRGRLVTGDMQQTADFGIRRSGGIEETFDLAAVSKAKWYGHYHTAGGYMESSAAGEWSHSTYHYYPVWLETDGKLHFAHVQYKQPFTISAAAADALGYSVTSPRDRVIQREQIDARRLEPDPPEDEDEPGRDEPGRDEPPPDR